MNLAGEQHINIDGAEVASTVAQEMSVLVAQLSIEKASLILTNNKLKNEAIESNKKWQGIVGGLQKQVEDLAKKGGE